MILIKLKSISGWGRVGSARWVKTGKEDATGRESNSIGFERKTV